MRKTGSRMEPAFLTMFWRTTNEQLCTHRGIVPDGSQVMMDMSQPESDGGDTLSTLLCNE